MTKRVKLLNFHSKFVISLARLLLISFYQLIKSNINVYESSNQLEGFRLAFRRKFLMAYIDRQDNVFSFYREPICGI